MAMISYAQNCEDVILARAFEDRATGFYVDVGAASPTEASVTRHFYEAGWHGINIEPLPHWAAELRVARQRDLNLEVAIGAAPGSTVLYRVQEDPSLSTLSKDVAGRHRAEQYHVEEIPVRVMTLTEVLSEVDPGRIDFLKVDVEGAEGEVLAGLDLGRFRPLVIVAEATEPYSLVPTYDRFEPLLVAGGYLFASTDGINRYYVAEEARELAPLLVPANALDDYIALREQLLVDEIDRLRLFVRDLERDRDSDTTPPESTPGAAVVAAPLERSPERRRAATPTAITRSGRIAVVATPGSGAGRLAAMLSGALDAPEAVAMHPADIAWGRMPERGVLRLVWPRTEWLRSQLRVHGFTVLTISRHPLDEILSMLRLAQLDRATAEWLDGEGGGEDDLAGADPTDPAFLTWAAGERGRALVDIGASWWSDPGVVRVRYEELVEDPSASVSRLLHLASLGIARALEAPRPQLAAATDLEEISGSWRRYLTAEVAEGLLGAHARALEIFGYERSAPERLPEADAARSNWRALCVEARGILFR